MKFAVVLYFTLSICVLVGRCKLSWRGVKSPPYVYFVLHETPGTFQAHIASGGLGITPDCAGNHLGLLCSMCERRRYMRAHHWASK